MAYVEELVPADRATVWAAIADPGTYPRWLAGCKHIRAVDPDWPAPGSAFHHRVGVGPIKIDDRTSIEDIDPGRRLVLCVRATMAIRAIVTFELREVDGGTMVGFEEEPARRLIGNLVRPVMDPLTHGRNKASLRALADLLAEQASSRPTA